MMTHARTLKFLMLPLAAMVLFPVAAMAQAVPAVAQATDAFAQAKQLAGQVASLPKLTAVFTYVIGTVFAAKGLLSLRRHISAPDNNPLSNSLAFLAVSAFLILLPYTIRVISGSIANPDVTNTSIQAGADVFKDKGLTDPSGTDFRQAQYRAAGSVLKVPNMMAVFAYVCGAFFAASGLIKLKDWINDADRNPLNPALFRLVTAALMVAFPHVLLITTGSFFGRTSGSGFSVDVNVKTPMGKLDAFKRL